MPEKQESVEVGKVQDVQDGGLNYETSKKNQVCHYLCVCFTSMKMKAGEVEKHRKIESSKCVYGFWWWGETQCVGQGWTFRFGCINIEIFTGYSKEIQQEF